MGCLKYQTLDDYYKIVDQLVKENRNDDLIIEYQNRMDEEDLVDLYTSLLDDLKYYEFLKEEDIETYDERKENLEEYKSILVNVENSKEDIPRIDRLREAFDDAILSDAYLQSKKEDPFGVTVSTIHSIKGWEFDYVFLIGMEELLFPSARSIEEGSMEEERRVAYVAMTRAKKRLYLTRAQKRLINGTTLRNGPSPFFVEFLGLDVKKEKEKEKGLADYTFDDIRDEDRTKEKPINKISNNANGYHTGDRVVHKSFGEGIIVAINNDIGSIFFDSEKRLVNILLTHPALSKK